MSKGRRKERTVDPKFKFLRLLDHLTSAERALEYQVPYYGSEVVSAGSSRIVTPGDFVNLGTQNTFWLITGYSVGPLSRLFAEQDNKDSEGRPSPPMPKNEFWINWAALLEILKKEGQPVIHPDTGEEVHYEPIELPDGTIFEAWEQARRDYEREVLPPKETYYSVVIQSYYNPSPSLKQWEEGLSPEAVDRASHALSEILGKPKGKLFSESVAGNDSLDAILSKLPQEERDFLIKQLGIKPPEEEASPLAKLIKDYMKKAKIKDVETLVWKMLEPTFGPKPEQYPFYDKAVEFLENHVFAGERPFPGHDGYFILGALSKVLKREDGSPFEGGAPEIVNYYFPEEQATKAKNGKSSPKK